MKVFRIVGRSIRDAFKSVIRNFGLAFSSVSCITITLIIVAIFAILSYNVDKIATLIKQDFTIVVFLEKETNEERTIEIKKELEAIQNISEIEFESKEKIAKDLSDSSDVFKSIIDNWKDGKNPLKDSYLIKVKDALQINETAKKVKDIEGISLVKYGEEIVGKLLQTFNFVQQSLIVMVVALVIVTIFLISNTIKLTIYSRKREIEIMRLVGSSNTGIKLPFIFEGLFIGIIGSLIPIALTIFGYQYIYTHFDGKIISEFFTLIKPVPFVYLTSVALLILGIFVGMWGSSRAVRKYLRI